MYLMSPTRINLIYTTLGDAEVRELLHNVDHEEAA